MENITILLMPNLLEQMMKLLEQISILPVAN